MKLAFGIGAAALMLAFGTPAQAITVIYGDCDGGSCFPGQVDNVNLDTATTGHVGNTTTQVSFDSTSDDLALGQGAASIVSPAPDDLINNLTFSILNGLGFGLAEFQIQSEGAGTLTINTVGGLSEVFNFGSLGSNRFSINAGNDVITSATLSSTAGFNTFRQLRLGAIAAVPEPATWAMMLVGFGILGGALRRRKTGERVRVSYA